MADQLAAKRCNNCVYWKEDMADRDPHDENWGFGSCRRSPPRLIDCMVQSIMPQLRYGQQTDPDMDPLSLTRASLFPATFATDWCGMHMGAG